MFYMDDARLEVDDAPCDLSQICNDLWALGEEKWITLSPIDTLQKLDGGRSITPLTGDVLAGPSGLCEQDASAPPVPPRVSSRSLSAELHIESPVSTLSTCHSPCSLLDRKCSSPSIVRKFGAMLQENEGKVLVDGAVVPCSAPPSAKCSVGCCHSRWSCDSSNFANVKSPAQSLVPKSFSEVNILSAAQDSKNLQVPPMVKDLPVDLLLSSLETSALGLRGQSSKRNIMLEQKTAEFNRTLFQAEMGRSAKEAEEEEKEKEPDASHAGISSSAESLNPAGGASLLWSGDVPESTLRETKHLGCGPEGQETKLTFQSEPQLGLSDDVVKLTSHTASSPSRKWQGSAASEDIFPVAAPPESAPPGSSVDCSKTKKLSQAKPGSAKAAVSIQQSSAESKQKPATQPRLVSVQPDPGRTGPRVMNDHPWKPLTLAAYPRPEGSRSNYGALERILKNYESAGQAGNELKEQAEVLSSSSVSQTIVTELVDLMDVDPLTPPPTLRHAQPHEKFKSHSSVCVKEIHRTVQVGSQLAESVKKIRRSQFCF